MLVHWLSPYLIFGAGDLFGPADELVKGLTTAWCIAILQRLVGPIDLYVNSAYQENFLLADYLESNTYIHPHTKLETQYIRRGTLRRELEQLPGPKVSPDLVEFIEYLLVMDHTKRPTASEALQHPYLRSICD